MQVLQRFPFPQDHFAESSEGSADDEDTESQAAEDGAPQQASEPAAAAQSEPTPHSMALVPLVRGR